MAALRDLLYLVALAWWTGTAAYFGGSATPSIFARFTRTEAGQIVEVLFPGYYRTALATAALLVVVGVWRLAAGRPRAGWLLALAAEDGIEVVWGELGGALGSYDASMRRITLDRSLEYDPLLARAVLAHELGHHATRHLANDPGRWEMAARRWALRYLIPESRARQVWRQAVETIAQEAAVPPAWAAARLLECIM